MEDKENQIEEMANIIHRTEFVDISGYEEEKISEELLKHYQPKLPEDSVVLSREEKQEYENLVKLLIYDKPIKSRVYEVIKDIKERERKETAEKILDQIKFLVEERNGADIEDLSVDGTILEEILNELAKQYGVEVEK